MRTLSICVLAALLASAAGAQPDPAGTNLALGKSYTVESPYSDPLLKKNEQSWPDPDGTKLTDGVFGSETALAPFVGFIRADRRAITVDLGADATVRRVAASFLNKKDGGIYFPEEVTFYLSSDTTNWAKLATVPTQIPLSTVDPTVQKFEFSGFEYAARYVRVEFPTNIWVFCDEIQAWGEPGVAESVARPEGTPIVVPEPAGFPVPGEVTGGARQQVLIYNGYYASNPTVALWTADDFKPYVTYVDTQGESRDLLFDSFLFLTPARAPSGRDYGPGAEPSNQRDWEFYLDHTFAPGYQLPALNQAVSRARADLGRESVPAYVVLTIPYASPLQGEFAEGLNFKHSEVGVEAAMENRLKAIRWYIDAALERWANAGLDNLTLTGFYWYGEAVRYGMSPAEEQVMSETAAYVHEKGLKFFWIPYYFGEGFRHWQRMGFDVVNMQPNYMFQAVSAERVPVAATAARQYGMGVEMELDSRILKLDAAGAEARDKLRVYLDTGTSEGYRDSFCNWYQDVKSLLNAARSDNAEVRGMYDLVYQWIRRTATPTVP